MDPAINEGIKTARFIRHEPALSDETIAQAEARARDYYERQRRTAKETRRPFHEGDWCVARESMSVEVPPY